MASNNYSQGAQVEHLKFGLGTVMSSTDERIVINREFESVEEFIREYVTNLSRSGAFIRSKTPLPVGTRFHVAFPQHLSEEVTHEVVVENLRAQGFVRIALDGVVKHLDDLMTEHVDITFAKEVLVIVDRLVVSDESRGRLAKWFATSAP